MRRFAFLTTVSLLAIFLIACGGTQTSTVTAPLGEIAPSPEPFDCVVLDPEFCALGTPVYDRVGEEEHFVGLGFNLPPGTKIYAPFAGNFHATETGILSGFSHDDPGRDNHAFHVDEAASRTQFYAVVAPNSYTQGLISAAAFRVVEKGEAIGEVPAELLDIIGGYNVVIHVQRLREARAADNTLWDIFSPLEELFGPLNLKGRSS